MYTERVSYQLGIAEKLIERGQRIALSERMPPPLSTDPSWYQCKFCPAHEFCHETKMTKEVNCRTCAHSTPKPDSTWHCERYDSAIEVEYQHEGCEAHTLHPDLVPWKMRDSEIEWTAVYEINGKNIQNGSPESGAFTSKELLTNSTGCTDAFTQKVRAHFPGARVVR
jgi:hypothetical protein